MIRRVIIIPLEFFQDGLLPGHFFRVILPVLDLLGEHVCPEIARRCPRSALRLLKIVPGVAGVLGRLCSLFCSHASLSDIGTETRLGLRTSTLFDRISKIVLLLEPQLLDIRPLTR